MLKEIKVLQVGLGTIGQKMVSYIFERKPLRIIGAVDLASDKVGFDLGNICGFEKVMGITVQSDVAAVIKNEKPDVAVLTTVSDFKLCAKQAQEFAKLGIHVVSTCEEMFYPWDTEPDVAAQLDRVAKANGVSVLGTGINPGFLMDFLPVIMTGICQNVERIKVSRVQDATFRRVPFQQKIGAALTLDEFEAKKKTGTMRHVGLTESVQMIARKLGWKLDKTEDIILPVVAESKLTCGYKDIEPGMVAGVNQIGKGWVNGQEVITLEFIAAVGQDNPADTVEIKGVPNIVSTIPGGVNGDIGTCAITTNAIKAITEASPGLRTMADMPAISFFANL